MTDLLKDLAEATRALDVPKDGMYSEAAYKAVRFVRAHAAEIEANARDAARYRWLRGDGGAHSMRWPRWRVEHWTGFWNPVQDVGMDEAIDAAMRSAKDDGND